MMLHGLGRYVRETSFGVILDFDAEWQSKLMFLSIIEGTNLSGTDIPSLLKDNQVARDSRLPVNCWPLQSLRHRTVILVATQMWLTLVCLLPV